MNSAIFFVPPLYALFDKNVFVVSILFYRRLDMEITLHTFNLFAYLFLWYYWATQHRVT